MVKTPEFLEVFGNKLRVRVSGICIVEGKLLLVKHLHVGKAGYLWAPPGGGLNYEERLEDCIIREFKEETGFAIAVEKFLFLNEFIEAPLHAIEIFYHVRIIGGHLKKGIDPELSLAHQLIADVKFVDNYFLKNEDPIGLHSSLIRGETIEGIFKINGVLGNHM